MSVAICVLIYLFHSNAIDNAFIFVLSFALLSLYVYSSVVTMHFVKIINPLHGSTDRTVRHLIQNDLIKDVKDLELFGSRVNKRKMSIFRHKNNESLWLRAFKSVNVKNMKYLLTIDPNIDINETDSKNNRTPLIYAAIKGNLNAVNLLLGVPIIDVNHCDNQEFNALMYAVKNQHFEIAQLLIESGSNVNQADSNGSYINDICCTMWRHCIGVFVA